jgi:prolipoprotein diacylglyceryltransferase
MLQTLFHIPNQVLGIPILRPEGSNYGFGLLLLVVLLCGGVGLWNKYRRQGTEGDFAGAAMVLGIICLAIIFVLPRISDPEGLPIRGYGAMLLIAVVSGVVLGMWRAKQVGANPEIILSMMFLIFIGGLVGARGLFVIEYWKQFKPDTKLTVRDEDGQETVTLDSDTAIAVDGEKAEISDLRAGQRVKLTPRQQLDGALYARRVTAETSDTSDATDATGLTDGKKIVALDHWSLSTLGKSLGKIADVTKGGIVVYGALLGAAVPFVWYIGKHRLPILPLCDIVVASLLLGQALGRIGCLCNGCCYGSVCEKPNLPQVQFPYQSPPYLHQVEASANPLTRSKLFIAGLALKKVPDTDGVEIAAVEEGSLAEAHGLKPGMRITAITVIPNASEERAKDSLDSILQGHSVSVAAKSFVDPTVEEAYRLLYLSSGETLAMRLEGSKGVALAAWSVQEAAPRKSLPVHPTQLYDFISAGIMALFAWLYFPFRRRDGEVFAVMLTIFPISRFLIEWVRTDEPGTFFRSTIAAISGHDLGLTISQAISLGLLLSAIPFWWWVLRKPRDSTLKPADWSPLNAHWAEGA